MLQRIEHVGILVSDLDRSVAWYATVLGLELKRRVRLDADTELAFLGIGESEVELVYKAGEALPPPEGRVNHLAFTVTDVAAVLARLKAHGVELLDAEPVYLAPLNVRIAFFRGPDGELLELMAQA